MLPLQALETALHHYAYGQDPAEVKGEVVSQATLRSEPRWWVFIGLAWVGANTVSLPSYIQALRTGGGLAAPALEVACSIALPFSGSMLGPMLSVLVAVLWPTSAVLAGKTITRDWSIRAGLMPIVWSGGLAFASSLPIIMVSLSMDLGMPAYGALALSLRAAFSSLLIAMLVAASVDVLSSLAAGALSRRPHRNPL
jgi:hypothetical protein